MKKITPTNDNWSLEPPNMVPRIDSRPHQNDGKRLRKIRIEVGLTQKELASALGCTARTVGNYERANSEIPQPVRRLVFELTGVDIVPPHSADEDPDLVVRQYHERQRPADITQSLTELGVRPTWLARFKRFRAMAIYRSEYQISPARRFYEAAVRFCYLSATLVLGIEKIQRDFGDWGQNQRYHDILLVVSVVMTACLTLPAIQTIPWGTTTRAK